MNTGTHANDARQSALEDFLRDCFGILPHYTLLSGDASFRRYWRLLAPRCALKQSSEAGTAAWLAQQNAEMSCVLMDAPPPENAGLFVRVSRELARAGLRVPQLLQVDEKQGFVLMEDLGDRLLSECLQDFERQEFYLQRALALLGEMQEGMRACHNLPLYNKSLLLKELSIYKDWFLPAYPVVEATFLCSELEALAQAVAAQPRVYVHRDFHSRNLLETPQGEMAMLDYQDRVAGPASYDLISLTRDCYRRYDPAQVDVWHEEFRQKHFPEVAAEQWQRYCDECSLQRHVKVLGIFRRLAQRDGKKRYLGDIPRVMRYAVEEAQRLPYPRLCTVLRQQAALLAQETR